VSPTDAQLAVLGLLAESDLQLTPNNIARNTDYSAGYVRKQCIELVTSGHLARDDDGTNPFYEITSTGRAHLGGE
jgi:DNA-binding IclR family transcriptional regulator